MPPWENSNIPTCPFPCFSQEDKDHEECQLAESESLFADSPGATAWELHDSSTSSSALVAQQEASLLLPSTPSFSSSVSVSDDGPHSSIGPSFFMSFNNSGSEHQHNESVHKEDSTSLASSGILSNYRDNCESLEAHFESLLYNTYDSNTNELQSANDEDSDEVIANMPTEGHDEVMNYLLEDSFCMHKVLPARYQEQIKKLHPVEEEPLIIMRKNHM